MTEGLKKDPAVEKWAAMRDHTHLYYRFNLRKLIPTAVMLIGIPAGLVYFTLKSFVGKGREGKKQCNLFIVYVVCL